MQTASWHLPRPQEPSARCCVVVSALAWAVKRAAIYSPMTGRADVLSCFRARHALALKLAAAGDGLRVPGSKLAPAHHRFILLTYLICPHYSYALYPLYWRVHFLVYGS